MDTLDNLRLDIKAGLICGTDKEVICKSLKLKYIGSECLNAWERRYIFKTRLGDFVTVVISDR